MDFEDVIELLEELAEDEAELDFEGEHHVQDHG
jgi:hypothetical protein